MSGAEWSCDRVFTGVRILLPILAVLTTVVVTSRADATNCVQVRNLLRRGLSIAEVAEFTGLSVGDIQSCAAGQRGSVVIQPAGPPPHGAAGPPPSGAAGPAPHGAAGPPPHGAAGSAPHGAAGPAPHGAAGPAPGGFAP